MNTKVQEVMRFCMVGVVAVAIQFACYYLLIDFCGHNIALPVSYLVSLSFNYLLTLRFTFKVSSNTKNGVGFIVSHCVNFALQFLFLNFFIGLGMDRRWAIVPVFMVCVPINFILVRLSMKR